MCTKSVNKGGYSKNEADHEEPSITDNPVGKEPSYFNIFERFNNLVNKLDVTCKRWCMATSTEKYYTKMHETLIDYNDCNNVTFSNEKIQDAMHKDIAEEK